MVFIWHWLLIKYSILSIRKKTASTKKIPKLGTKTLSKDDESKRQCQECNKVFHCSGNLSRHIRRVHLKQKHFSCDLCK